MDIIQVGRTIKRIADLLQGGNETQAAALAQEYVGFCRATSRRLEQCETMLKAGDDYQALQLAESPPNLLDLITLLAFRGSEEWRAYCVLRQCTTAEAFDGNAIRLLNAAYGMGITADHRLYKDYRQAVLNKKFEEALLAGRLILKLNPEDEQAQADIARLEARVVEANMDALASALRKKKAEGVLECIKQIEELNLEKLPQGGVWREAQLFHARIKLEQLFQTRDGGDWLNALWSIDEIRGLLVRHGLQFEGSQLEDFSRVEAWAVGERRAFEQERDYQRSFEALENQFESVEKLGLTNHDIAPQELRAAKACLDTRWEEFMRLRRAPTNLLQNRWINAQQLLNARITAQDEARKKNRIIKSSLAAVAAILLFTLLSLWVGATSDARELRRLIAARDLQRLSNQVATVTTKLAAQLKLGGLSGALEQACSCLASENALRAGYDQLWQEVQAIIPSLPPDPSGTNLLTIQGKVNALIAKCGELAPDYRTNAEDKLTSLTNAWLAYLEPKAQAINKSFGSLLRDIGGKAEHFLHYTNSAEDVALVLRSDIKPRMEQMRALTNNPVPHLRVVSNLLADFRRLSDEVESFEQEATNYVAAVVGLTEARTVEAYLSRLEPIAKSRFHAPITSDFISIPNWRATSNNVVGTLLFRNDPKGWDHFQGSPALVLRPPGELPEDQRRKLGLLTDEPSIAWITRYSRYAITRHTNGGMIPTNSVVYLRDQTGQGFDRRPKKEGGGYVFYGSVYDPLESPNTLVFQKKTYEDWELKKDQKLARLPTPERELMVNARFAELANETGDKTLGLLDCFDALNQHKIDSTLCRAWMFIEACNILERGRIAWGGQYAPAVEEHKRNLLQIVENRIDSGDWMVPAKEKKYHAQIEAFFQKAQAVSYVKQARFLHALTEEVAQTGFTFAGYTNVRGKLVLVENSSRNYDLFGWGKDGKHLQLVARWNTASARHVSVCDPLPFCPLFALQGVRESIKERAASKVFVSLNDPCVSGWLPPLFDEQ